MSTRIPIARPDIGDAEIAAVQTVMRSGSLIQGIEVEAFEGEFAKMIGARHAVAVSSGTAALVTALMAAEIGPGVEVIVPSFTFAATANAVALVGASPRFVDIDPESFCLDPAGVEAAINSATAAIVGVHLYGRPFSPRINEMARRHGLVLIEDAAQAHLAQAGGAMVGTWGDLGVFSFYPTKNMTTGEGGMVVTGDAELARRSRLVRNQGMDAPYRNEIVGHNFRMTDIAAAIGRVQLTKLESATVAREKNAAAITSGLEGCDDLVTPRTGADERHVFHQYTLRSRRRDSLIAALDRAEIDARVYYPTPVHRLAPFEASAGSGLVESDRAAAEVFSVPVGPHVGREEIDRIVEALIA